MALRLLAVSINTMRPSIVHVPRHSMSMNECCGGGGGGGVGGELKKTKTGTFLNDF